MRGLHLSGAMPSAGAFAARRVVRFGIAALAVVSALVTPHARAQTPPELPAVIRLVVPFPPGGSNDIAARMIARLLAPRLNRNVVVENRAGASGFIGAMAVARAPKDGSVLLVGSGSLVSAAATKNNVTVDILKDLTPIAILSEAPQFILVPAASPLRTPADLVAAARANPDTITNGSPGTGTMGHLAGELINDMAKIQIKHIPYTGGGPAAIDLIAGRLDINIVSNSATAAFVTQGKLRPIAITLPNPSPDFPGVPTVASVVPGYEVTQWQAVWAPAGTPAAIIERLNREINEVVKAPEFAGPLRDDGGVALSLTPAQADAKARAAYQMWRTLAKNNNLIID